ncbi:MAG: hypothetical protein ACP5PT_00790 [Brevinematia bacterium]
MKSSKKFYFSLLTLAYLSVIIRVLLFPDVSWDYENALSLWYNTLKSEGFSAFSKNFYSYTPTYMYLMYLLTFLPLPSLYSIKLLSAIFDIILAFVGSKIVFSLTEDKKLSIISFVTILLLPTVIINSSRWGQFESIYTAFILLSLFYIIKEKYFLSFLFYSISFILKLQSIFVLPALGTILIIKVIKEKDFKLLLLPLLIPLSYILAIIPSYIAGRDLKDLLLVYFNQTQFFTELTMSAPNIYTIFPENLSEKMENIITKLGIIFSLVLTTILAIIFIVKSKKAEDIQKESILMIFLVFALIEPYFLPRMHDRYFYIADIISVIFGFKFKDKWFVPVATVLASLFGYIQVRILFGLSMVAIPFGIVIIWFTIFTIKNVFSHQLKVSN